MSEALSCRAHARRMLIWGMFAAILLPGAIPALAQTPPDPKPEAGLKLTAAQRQLIYASISKQTHKSTATPPTFAPTLGSAVPEAIELAPMPDTIAEVVPQTRGHAYAFVAGQVLIVEPRTRQVVEIITRS